MGTNFAKGWDLVVCVTSVVVNKMIGKAYDAFKLPRKFDADLSITLFGQAVHRRMKGTFAAMALTGGTGADIRISLPVISGTITGENGYSADISGVTAQVTVRLTLIKSPAQTTDGINYDYLIDFTSADAIVAFEVSGLKPDLSGQKTEIEVVMAQYLRTQTADKSFKVATINLGATRTTYPFLAPCSCAYAYLDTGGDRGLFGIGAHTNAPRPEPAPSTLQIEAGMVPDGASAGVTISNPILMRFFVIPAVATAFSTSRSNFSCSGDPASVGLAHHFDLDAKYHPTMTHFSSSVDSGMLDFQNTFHATPSKGIEVKMEIHARYSLTISGNPGSRSVGVHNKLWKVKKDVDLAWWVKLLAGPIVSAIIAAIVKAATPTPKASSFSLGQITPNLPFGEYLDIQGASLPTPLLLEGAITV